MGVVTRKEFYEAHKRCPRCGSKGNIETLLAVTEVKGKDFIDNMNTFRCTECGKEGCVSELLPSNIVAQKDFVLKKYK